MTGEWLPPRPPGGEPPKPPPPPPELPRRPDSAPPPAQQLPPGYRQPGWQQPQPQQQPPNNDAVAGFTCAIIGSSLLLLTGGLSTIVSLILGIVAIPFSRRGKRNVDEGRTHKQRNLASAGFVIGIVTIVLSVIATIAWILLLTLVDWEELDDSDGDPFDGQFDFQVIVRTLGAAVRLLG